MYSFNYFISLLIPIIILFIFIGIAVVICHFYDKR